MLNENAHQTLVRIQILVLICEKSEGQVIDKRTPKIHITAGQTGKGLSLRG